MQYKVRAVQKTGPSSRIAVLGFVAILTPRPLVRRGSEFSVNKDVGADDSENSAGL